MARYRLAYGWLYVLLVPALVAGQAPSNKDQYGDPLPPGAFARLGTVRWRHEAAIGFAAFLPDGKSVLSVSIDQAIHVWEFPSGKEIRRITLATADSRPSFSRPLLYYQPRVDVSMDGKVVATFFGDANQPRIRLHDVGSGKELPSLEAENLEVKKLFFSSNRQRLLSLGFDGQIRVWDCASGKELRKIPAPGGRAGIIPANDGEGSFVLSPDGDALMHVGHADFRNIDGAGLMRDTHAPSFIDVNTGKEIGPAGHTAPLESIQFTADSKQVITQAADGSTRRWDAGAGKGLGTIHVPADLPKGPVRQARNVVVSPDGQIAATASPGQGAPVLNLIATDSGKHLSTLAITRGPGPGQPKMVLFGPGNKLLAVSHLPRPVLMAKGGTGPTIELFDVAGGNLLHTFTVALEASKKGIAGAARTPQAMFFSPSGKTLAWSVDGTNLSIWDTVSGQNTHSLTLPSNVTLEGASFTPDGRCLAVAINGGGAMLFELAAGAPRSHFGKTDGPTSIADPKPLIVGVGTISIKPSPSSRLAVSPNGETLALAGPDNVLRVWDIATGKDLAAFQNAVKLTAVTFSPDGKTLASACADTTALVWDVARAGLSPAAASTRNANLEECWQALAGNDGVKAFRAIRDMSAMPKETLVFFKDHVQPAAKPDLKRAQELIALLDHDQYKVREKAISELHKMDEQIVPALDKALAGNPTLESKLRLNEIRGRMTAKVLKGERLRRFRAVEVLERIGTPQSRQVLQELAAGEPGVLLTTSAREALER
ncbi:MAG TPA: hypothetical protein VNX28_09160 [Gemmataceae bacterium]|jgi:WD40 repeat protein|nr:hypothetical protein [Gemmataceae bacterium]